MIHRKLRKNEWMGVELSAKQSTMDDNVAGFGLSVMASDCHVACEQTVFSEPSMDSLTGKREISSHSRTDCTALNLMSQRHLQPLQCHSVVCNFT